MCPLLVFNARNLLEMTTLHVIDVIGYRVLKVTLLQCPSMNPWGCNELLGRCDTWKKFLPTPGETMGKLVVDGSGIVGCQPGYERKEEG